MLAYLVVAATLLAPRPASPPAPDSAETIRSVLAFEDGRFAAMVRADTTWLRDALAEDLSYVHTSARSETKAQYLECRSARTDCTTKRSPPASAGCAC